MSGLCDVMKLIFVLVGYATLMWFLMKRLAKLHIELFECGERMSEVLPSMDELLKRAEEKGRAVEREKVTNSVNAIIQFIKNNSMPCKIEGHSFKMVGSNLVINLLEQIGAEE